MLRLDCWSFTSLHVVEILSALVFSVRIILVNVHLSWLNWFHFVILVGSPLVILIGYMNFLLLFLDLIRMSLSRVPFLAQLDSGILHL